MADDFWVRRARQSIFLGLMVLWLALGSDCTTKLKVAVPLAFPDASKLADAEMLTDEKPPYPPLEGLPESKIRKAFDEALKTAEPTLSKEDRKARVDGAVDFYGKERHYGPAVKMIYKSRKNPDDSFKIPAPRWVQLVRRKLEIRKLDETPIATYDFHETIATPGLKPLWISAGGTPLAAAGKGWFVDLIPKLKFNKRGQITGFPEGIGHHPMYRDNNIPFLFQEWASGITTMVDVPGLSNPWDSVVAGTPLKDHIFIQTFEAHTWNLSRQDPTIVANGDTDPPPLGTGGSKINRTPLGFVSWKWTIKVMVGKDLNSTKVMSFSFPDKDKPDGPVWVDALNGDDDYKALMNGTVPQNYPDWGPPYD